MANNQMINFNSQDVANMYRRNQLAQALQERMNAPTPVHTYQGFQAPISPLTGLTKALDVYSVFQNEKNQEDRYQAEKVAAEQKAQNIINTQNEKATEFRNKFNPVVSEEMIGGNTSFTPKQYADAINAYGKPQEPTQASDMLNGEPTTYGRTEGTLKTTITPRTPEEIMRLESEGFGSNNPQMKSISEYSFESRKEAERAKVLAEQAKLNLQEKRDNRTENNQTKAEIATANNEAKKEVAQIMGGLRRDQIEDSAQIKRDAVNLKIKEKTDAESKAFNDSNDVINNIESDVESLNALGGLRNENQNPYQSSVATFGNMLPAVFQSKEALELREKIDANIEALVPVLMKASGMSARQLDSNVERMAFRKSLGGTGTGYEANNKIIERMRNMIKPSSLQSNEFPSKENAPTTNRTKTKIYNPTTGKIE